MITSETTVVQAHVETNTEFVFGKVLVVDDKFEEVKEFISELLAKGLSVQYWNPINPKPIMTNVRIVVLDLVLSEEKEQTPSSDPSYYLDAARILAEIEGPFLVVILATGATETTSANAVKEAYSMYVEPNGVGPLRGYIATSAVDKMKADFKQLYSIITENVHSNHTLKLILDWEALLDSAKDLSLQEFTREQFDREIKGLISIIENDVGKAEAVPREFVANMIRLESRFMHSGREFERLAYDLRFLLSQSVKEKEDAGDRRRKDMLSGIKQKASEASVLPDDLLPHLQMYYFPHKKERPWTGDIIKLSNLGKYWDYGIVLTAACDLAKAKADRLLVCSGFSVKFNELKDPNHPIYRIGSEKLLDAGILLSKEQDEATIEKIAKYAYKRYCDKEIEFPLRYAKLWKFNEKPKGETFGLCFDFQFTIGIPVAEIDSTYQRLARLDSPFIDELLSKYASYCTRIGVPAMNSPF